jgi:hypothetical protein
LWAGGGGGMEVDSLSVLSESWSIPLYR